MESPCPCIVLGPGESLPCSPAPRGPYHPDTPVAYMLGDQHTASSLWLHPASTLLPTPVPFIVVLLNPVSFIVGTAVDLGLLRSASRRRQLHMTHSLRSRHF